MGPTQVDIIKQSHTLLLIPRRPMGTLEPVPDCAVVVGGELEQSLEEEGRTGAASDIVKVIDWVQPNCSAGIIKQSHTL